MIINTVPREAVQYFKSDSNIEFEACEHEMQALISSAAQSAKSYCSHHGRTCSCSVLFCGVPVTLLKFSGSPCLDNHLSERIQTCTIDTL